MKSFQRRTAFVLATYLCSLLGSLVFSAAFAAGPLPATIDYEQPPLLTGTIFEAGSDAKKVLFKFKRSATRSGSAVHILREFTNPDGSLAARERVVYDADRLVSFQLDELQTGSEGKTLMELDPKTSRYKAAFQFITSSDSKTRKKTDNETLALEPLVADMIPYFVTAHWDELFRGTAVSFRFIAQSRLETVGFKLVKDGEVTWRGKPTIRLKMEPTNFVIAQIVDPLFFIVEKEGAHRILEYDGRTTPKVKRGKDWKDLDAVTIYDWN